MGFLLVGLALRMTRKIADFSDKVMRKINEAA
jgi:hypothetical protein